MMKAIPKSVLDFLKKLEKNNNRDWFNLHKDKFLLEEERMIEFSEGLRDGLGKFDLIVQNDGKKILYRIYRDIRFSKDKTPYKNHRSGGFKRDTPRLRGGYYFHIQPKNQSFLAGGFWGPNKEDLQRIRQELAYDDQPLRKITASKKFKETFGTLQGEQLKTAPRGYEKDHPAVDLLRHKQFVIYRKFTDQEIMADSFMNEAVQTFKLMRPFFDYMSDVLTTDSNGEPLF